MTCKVKKNINILLIETKVETSKHIFTGFWYEKKLCGK